MAQDAPGGDELPLDGIRVVELGGGLAAGYCSHLLAGYGADVVQVGEPGLTEDEDTYLSRGKRRIAPPGASLDRVLAAAAVVVDGRRVDADGPTAGEIRAAHPHLVVTAITPFGLDGPHAAHKATNIVTFANGGIMALTGERERSPLQTGGDQAFLLGGLHAFAATTTALVGALLQEEGDLIDISMQECASSMLEYCAAAWEYESLLIERSGNTPRAEWGVYQTLDGWAGVCALGRQIPALLDTLGLPHEDRFMDPVIRVTDAKDELMAHVLVFMLEHTKAELVALGPSNKLPLGAVRTPEDLLAHPPLEVRGFFDDGAAGRLPGRPFPGFGWAALAPVTETSLDDVLGSWSDVAAAGVAP
jgi:crotonobetainyl-CoA:carnitine CoA-transferase CaiB-like acyl-CoA transferase